MCKYFFGYLGDILYGNGRADLVATARIRNGWMKCRELFPFLTSIAPPPEMNGRVYASCVRSSMTYGSETRPLLVDVGLKFERAEMQMIRWMCDISLKDRRTNEELRRLVGVESITNVIITAFLTMLLIISVIHLEPKPPAYFIISLTTPVGPAAFPIFNPLIAAETSSSEIRQRGPITSGQSTSPSQSFSTFRSFSIYSSYHQHQIQYYPHHFSYSTR